MGYTQAQALAQLDNVKLENQIALHLQSNHYPPVPTSMIEPCILAIESYNDGDWEAEIPLPEGITFRGLNTAPCTCIITQHHLDAWLDDDACADY